jgi:hypothetical protein
MRKEQEVEISPFGGQDARERGIVQQKQRPLVHQIPDPADDEELDERGGNGQPLEHGGGQAVSLLALPFDI